MIPWFNVFFFIIYFNWGKCLPIFFFSMWWRVERYSEWLQRQASGCMQDFYLSICIILWNLIIYFFFFIILMFSWYYVRITSGKQLMEKVFGIWNVVVGTNQNDVKSFTPDNRAGTKWSVKTALICEFWERQSSFTVDLVLH